MCLKRNTLSIVTLSVILASCVFTCNTYGRSLYAITTCSGDPGPTLTAYNISGEEIEYQIGIQIDNGAIGLALDPDSGTLFATYDKDFGGNQIVLINARTMEQIKSVPVSDELAGIVYDQSTQKIYAVSRQKNFLYVYLWNKILRSLILETYLTLQNISDFGAYGLAFDEDNEILYVTDKTNVVKYYDSNNPNFAYLGSIDVNETATGIDFYQDGMGNKYLYTGQYSHSSGDHYFLVRTDITDVNNPVSTKKIVGDYGTYVVGIAADRQTGLIYITKWINRIEVYNNATFPTDPCSYDSNDILKPADIIVRGDVSYKPPLFYLEKVDDMTGCVEPNDYITYTILYGPNDCNHNNVVLTDYLPPGVDFDSCSDDGDYNDVEHTVTWNIGTLSASAPNYSVTLTVQVCECAIPTGTITNYCEIESDIAYTSVELDTPVCSWQPDSDIIYVDYESAAPPGTGMSWRCAYVDLQDALARADYNSEIRVAEGTYRPTTTGASYISFEMVNGVELYGGYAGYGEPDPNARDINAYETILSGDIDSSVYDSEDVVTATNVDETTVIDGFTIKKGKYTGIWCDDSSALTIKNNKVKEITFDGVACSINSAPSIIGCIIENNGHWGIVSVSGSSPTITNSIIRKNEEDGIYCKQMSESVSTVIENNWIYDNGTGGSTGSGIYIYCTTAPKGAIIRNNTIVKNFTYGIYSTWAEDANIINCIIWGNKYNEDYQLQAGDNCTFDVTYSCIEGDSVYDGDENINTDPCFVDEPNDDYHLTCDSNCIDEGDPNGNYDGQTDIDGEPRVLGPSVDMGADEYAGCFPICHPDYNEWVYVNMPNCWCYTRQCHGDADNKKEGSDKKGYYYVHFDDLNVLLAGWNTLEPPQGPGIATVTGPKGEPGICADFAHDKEGSAKKGYYRVHFHDLDILVANWNTMELPLGPGIPTDCLDCGGERQSKDSGEIDIKRIMKWLEEMWLEPEAQKAIDKDVWLKFIESVKSELKS